MCKKGTYYLQFNQGVLIPIKMYYARQASKIVLSPTYIVTSYGEIFDNWSQKLLVLKETGKLRLLSNSVIDSYSVQMKMINIIWYIEHHHNSSIQYTSSSNCSRI